MNDTTQTWYAIQHIPSGMCLPEKGSRKGKGGYTNDTPDNSYPPRLFKFVIHAFTALDWWLRGVATVEYDLDGDDRGIVSAPQTNRKRDDMRVVKVKITVPQPFKEKTKELL